MTTRNHRIALAAALATATLSLPAFAGSLADTHAWLEGQRTLTDGQTTPHVAGPAVRVDTMAAKQTAEDRWFLAELARTDGNTSPVILEVHPTSRVAGWTVPAGPR